MSHHIEVKTSRISQTAADKTAQVQATQRIPPSRGQSSVQASLLPPPVGAAVARPTPAEEVVSVIDVGGPSKRRAHRHAKAHAHGNV